MIKNWQESWENERQEGTYSRSSRNVERKDWGANLS